MRKKKRTTPITLRRRKNLLRNVRYRFSKRLLALREEHKLTQTALAKRSKLDRSYVNGIEKQKRNVSLDNIEKIAKGFGITLSQLFRDV